jgi:hypothetical protein
MSLPRRRFLQIAPLSLLAPTAWGVPADAAPVNEALQTLLTERLKQEGVALAAARLLPDGRLELAAASKPGTPAVSADRHGFEIGSITKVFTGLLLAEAAVRGAFARIVGDDRHLEPVCLVAAPIDRRLFPGWAMRDDPARSWMWTQEEVAAGAAARATPDAARAIFERLAAEAA